MHLELKQGTGILLNAIPLTLDNSEVLTFPSNHTGYAFMGTLKYSLLSHFFLGLQFAGFKAKGTLSDATLEPEDNNAQAYVFGSDAIIGFNIRDTRKTGYRFEYQLYYKLGAMTLKVRETEIRNNTTTHNISISDAGVGILSGVGFDVKYNFSGRLGMIGSVEVNSISSSFTDVYRPYRMFFKSPHTVSNYLICSVGISYQLFGHNENKTLHKRKSRKLVNQHLPWSI